MTTPPETPRDRNAPETELARRFQTDLALVAHHQSLERSREIRRLAGAFLGFGFAAAVIYLVLRIVDTPLNVIKALWLLLGASYVASRFSVGWLRPRSQPIAQTPEEYLLSRAVEEKEVKYEAVDELEKHLGTNGLRDAESEVIVRREYYRVYEEYVARVRVIYGSTAQWGRPPAQLPDSTQGEPTASSATSWILHLSDLHFSRESEASEWAAQLREDLRGELGRRTLTAVVLSGDLTNRAMPAEFAAATAFVRQLRHDFDLAVNQIIIVPGNHDLDWERSRASYERKRRSELPVMPEEGQYFLDGDEVELIADIDAHRRRFEPFASFYQAVRADLYPLEYDQQATIHPFEAAKILVLGLNSAWHIDHRFTNRAEINSAALGRALRSIDDEPRYATYMKIAVWHHPLHSADEDRIKDTGFVERLAKAGFRLALHGHIHRSDLSQFKYDITPGGRRVEVLGAGTFGAPTRELHPGFPLQYQLLQLTERTLRVHTRRREERNGAWKPDARWLRGPELAPSPSYEINL